MSEPETVEIDRKAPNNQDAEQAVISAMMLDVDAVLEATTIVRAEHFYRRTHGDIFDAITSILQDGGIPDPITVLAKLEARGQASDERIRPYLGWLMDAVPTSANIAYHAKIVRAHADRRILIRLAQELSEEAHNLNEDPSVVAQKAAQLLLPVAAHTKSAGFVRLKAFLYPLMEEIERRTQGKELGIPFGYASLDDKTGGTRPGDVVFYPGIPSCGKTALMLNIATIGALEHNLETAVISAEMGAKSLVERLLNSHGMVESIHTRKGTLTNEDMIRLGRAAGLLQHAPIWIDDTATPRLEDIKAKCRALKSKHPTLKRIMLDFIQLVGGNGESEDNRALALTNISYGLKGLAKELEVDAHVTCQVDAQAVEKSSDHRPRLHMIRWSQAMREAGDMIALVSRENQFHLDGPSKLLLDFRKMRDLEPFETRLNWVGKFMMVEEPKAVVKAAPPPPELPLDRSGGKPRLMS